MYKFKNLTYLIIISFLLGSCYTQKTLKPLSYVDGKVVMKNGNVKKGKITIEDQGIVILNNKKIESTEIEEILFYNNNKPKKKYSLQYCPLGSSGNQFWILKMHEGKNVDTYIGAPAYEVRDDGTLVVRGYMQVVSNGYGNTSTNFPNFPIFMKKKESENVKKVGVHSSSIGIRAGISRYLKDDPELCEYMRYKKMGYNDLEFITTNYEPNRTSELIIDGEEVNDIEKELISNDLADEIVYNTEVALPLEKQDFDIYKNRYSLVGFRFYKKFVSFGFDLGLTKTRYADELEVGMNHNGFDEKDFVLTNDDFAEYKLAFSFNTYFGTHLALNIKEQWYFVPGAYLYFGGIFPTEVSAKNKFLFGPMLTFDIGKKLGVGDILFFGLGYRYNKCILKKDDAKIYSNFNTYNPFSDFFIRVAYKF